MLSSRKATFDLLADSAPVVVLEVGGGRVSRGEPLVRLQLPETSQTQYANAQIDDYHGQGGSRFRWRAPLRLEVQARFSHDASRLSGTAGFGFWNDPFAMTGSREIRLPRTLWFFFGGPSTDLPLAEGVPGHGWKAATLDACRWEALATAPSAPLVVPMLHVPRLRRWLWPRVQRRLRIAEAALAYDLQAWHHYAIEWEQGHCRFAVDGQVVLDAPFSPKGPLGLVAWIDNQYMVATPLGKFRHGVVATPAQWLEIAALQVTQTQG